MMDIQFSDSMSKEEFEHLFRWREQVFPAEGKNIDWSQPDWHLYSREVGQLAAAHLGYGRYQLTLDERSIDVVGVGDVVVRPEHQGKGLPSKLFKHLHHCEHANTLAEVFTLFCPHRLESYYQQHGYRKFQGTVSFLQKGVATSSDDFILMYRGTPLTGKAITIKGEPW
ncbi:GNAT family N-acetyltransferase [Marinomonas mediterranea MMB-1]|nr:GNAT family N-acetyltransferase [Marinomonas mediterranea MMB-1]